MPLVKSIWRMMLTGRFGMVLRNMRDTAEPLALPGKLEDVTGSAAVGWCVDGSSSEWMCFARH